MPIEILIVALVGLLIGLSKGGFGPLLVALIAPLLSHFMPVSQAVATPLLLLMVGDAFAIWAYWKRWDVRYVKLLLPLAIVGVLVGTWFLETQSDDVLRRVLGLFTLTAAIYKLYSNRLKELRYEPRDWHGHVTGAASGFASAIANAGAYPFTAYMLLQDVNPHVFMGTTTLFFAIVNLLKLPLQINLIDGSQIGNILWAMPLVPIGVWLGRKFIDWVNPLVFERLMIVILIAASILLLI